jgi:hypothetical protein
MWPPCQLDHFDHRKFVVVDARIGWVGGAGVEGHFDDGRFHDLFVRVTGPVTSQLQRCDRAISPSDRFFQIEVFVRSSDFATLFDKRHSMPRRSRLDPGHALAGTPQRIMPLPRGDRAASLTMSLHNPVRVGNVACGRFSLDVSGGAVGMMSARAEVRCGIDGRLAAEHGVGRRSQLADSSRALSHLTLIFVTRETRAAGTAARRAAR